MNDMKRIIPDLNRSILFPLMGKMEKTESVYLEKLKALEEKCEKSLIDTLGRLSINATVKTERYSLPYKKESEVYLYGESYLNGAYEFHRVARFFVKELLNENVYKIRFYILIDMETDKKHLMGRIRYRLRYYPHY